MATHDKRYLADDFFEIRKKYFSTKKTYFAPSSAQENTIPVLSMLSSYNIDKEQLVPYQNDEAGLGLEARRAICGILQAEGEVFTPNEVTISPSITSASINVLYFLMSRGINKILLETPCYYATKFQIESFGLDLEMIPTYEKDRFEWNLDINKMQDTAIWVTQPRISLGLNQSITRLNEICCNLMSKNCFLVVDEATELQVPAIMANRLFNSHRQRIIRLRGLLKPFAINGPRIAFILHGDDIAEELKKFVWISHGGIDRFSVNTILDFSHKSDHYVFMKKCAFEQIFDNARRINQLLHNHPVKTVTYENGYTSALILPLNRSAMSKIIYLDKREKLINFVERLGVFPTLGPSMYFSYDGKHEFLRINYLTDIVKLSNFVSRLPSFFRNFCHP